MVRPRARGGVAKYGNAFALGERRALVRRGSHAVTAMVGVIAGFAMTLAFLFLCSLPKRLKCPASGVQAKDAWKCCSSRKQMRSN